MQTYYQFFNLPHHKSRYLSILFIVATLRTFVYSFLNLFLPILLLNQFKELGYYENKTFLLVGLTFFLLPLAHGLVVFFVGNLNAKIGTRVSLILGQLFFIVFLFLISLTKNIFLIGISFIIWGFATSFWWISYHILFLEIAKKKEFGREIGISEVLTLISGIIAPFLAGLFLHYYDKTTLYFISLIITILSIVLLSLEKDFEKLTPVSLKDIILEIKKRKRDLLAFIGSGGVEIVYSVVWPLFLYTVLKDYLKVGKFSSLVLLITAIFTFIAGDLSDKFKKDKVIRFGAGGVFFTFLGIIFFQNNPLAIFIFDIIYRLLSRFFYIPLTSLAYVHAIYDNKTTYIIFREIGYKIGNLLGLGFFILFVFLNNPFWLSFLFAAIFSLMPVIMKDS